MAEEHWPTLEEIEAFDKDRIDEKRVAAYRAGLRAAQRAYRLAEIRRQQGLTQTDVAAAMHVSQRRVSAVEHGDLSRTELGTVASYVQALGGRIEIVANFGDEHIVIGLRRGGRLRRDTRVRSRERPCTPGPEGRAARQVPVVVWQPLPERLLFRE